VIVISEQYKPFYAQKAKKIDLTKNTNLEGWWITNKFDGVGSITTCNDIAQMYSISKAKVSGEFTNFSTKVPHLIEELNSLNYQGYLHGEIISDNFKTNEENFGYVTGTLHADDAVERQEKSGKLKYVIYDMPSHAGTYEERYCALSDLFKNKSNLKYVSLMPILGVNHNDSWVSIFNSIVENGDEGCVLYNKENKYRMSDTSNLRNGGVVKCKASSEIEVLAIEKIEGQGKFKGTLGAIKCIDAEGRTFNCGSFNIDDSQRDYIWNNVEVPCVVEIIYYQRTKDSYKLPRLTRYRPDKDIDSWNKGD